MKKTGHLAHAHTSLAAERVNVVSAWHITEVKNRYPAVFSQRKVSSHTTVPMQGLFQRINNK